MTLKAAIRIAHQINQCGFYHKDLGNVGKMHKSFGRRCRRCRG